MTGGVLADLHVHVARAGGRPVKIAASPRLTLPGIIAESIERKGLDIVGIVDAQSPPVLEELAGLEAAGELVPLPGGGLEVSSGGRRLLFVLASEVEADEPGIGPVHYIVFLPDLDAARGFSSFLEGRVTNVSLSSQRARVAGDELARWALRAEGFLVPAHVFTPFKGYFGQGGTDLGRSFSDQALEAVPAVELGLSADTDLADLVPSLAPFTYLTSSDAHSPETIAREHTAFARAGEPTAPRAGNGGTGYDFARLARVIRAGELLANYGLDPRLGKYHRAFCPKCGFTSNEEAAARRVCPACGRGGLVGGVYDRIRTIAGEAATVSVDAPAAGGRPRRARPPYVHTIPLRYLPGVGPATLRKLLGAFGTELDVLHRVPEEDLAAVAGERLAEAIVRARAGTESLDITPGAGGRYGRLRS